MNDMQRLIRVRELVTQLQAAVVGTKKDLERRLVDARRTAKERAREMSRGT